MEPHNYHGIYQRFPLLKSKYVISYSVWETTELPESYKRSLSYVQEVWTASRYCHSSFSKCHDRVIYIPHVIERGVGYSDDDRRYIEQIVGYEKNTFYFLSVTKVSDPRKNVRALVDAFMAARRKMNRAVLIIKSYHGDPPKYAHQPGIVYLDRPLTDGQLNALYQLSDVYVSAHHSEGWGMSISDAMVFNKPVIATGYSGNMDFMNEDNSFPLACKEDYISPEDTNGRFKSYMKWGFHDQADLESKMRMLCESHKAAYVIEKVQNASESIKRFNRDNVGGIVRKRVNDLSAIVL
jgi:glycosyltransferase involved in cell wall biosynthesis